MKLLHQASQRRRGSSVRERGAFTLPEVLVAVGVMAMMLVSLYAGISQGIAVLAASREHQRATQIMLEKVEVLRLYTWDQLNAQGYVPVQFTERYDPASPTNATTTGTAAASGSGVVYYGSVTISSNPPVAAAYTNTMRLVTVTLNWTNGSLARSTSLRTLVSQYGIQDFVN